MHGVVQVAAWFLLLRVLVTSELPPITYLDSGCLQVWPQFPKMKIVIATSIKIWGELYEIVHKKHSVP